MNALDRLVSRIVPDVIERPLSSFARQQEKKGLGSLLEFATPLGFALSPLIPNTVLAQPKQTGRPEGSMATLGGQPVQWMDNKWVPFLTEGQMARQQQAKMTMNAPAAPSLPSPASQRAYETEKQIVAQQTAQDPLLQKYKVADLTKAYNTAKTPEEKQQIGLQIWATTNPQLAQRLKPGQVGYETSASLAGTQFFGTDVPGITQTQYSQKGEMAGVPFPGAQQAPNMTAFGMGADAQQFGVSPIGFKPPEMIGKNVFEEGFPAPSAEDLTQTQLALLKKAFASGLK